MGSISKEDIVEVITNPDSVTAQEGAPDFKEIQAKIKSGEMKIEQAAEHHVKDLEPQIDILMESFGIKNAWVSDESMVSDFALDEDDYLYQVAQRLKDK